MKNQLLNFLLLLLLPFSIVAQEGYSFTLVHNGGYSFSVAAVSNFDSGSFTPKTEQYGFTLVVPDDVTLTSNTVLPTGSVIINENAMPQLIQGTDVTFADATMSDKDLYQITVSTNAANFPIHINEDVLPLVTFTINGAPETGHLTLLDNGSTLASTPAFGGALDSFIQVDVTDDASTDFINGYLGQTALTSFSFSTLELIEFEEFGLVLYPNPVKDYLFIKGNINTIEDLHIYSINGKHIKHITKDFERINIKDLESSIYFFEVKTQNGSQTLKIIKR